MICTSSPPHPPKLRFQLKLDLIFTALMCNCAGELCQVGLENCSGCAEEEHMANAGSLSGETAHCTLVCIILTLWWCASFLHSVYIILTLVVIFGPKINLQQPLCTNDQPRAQIIVYHRCYPAAHYTGHCDHYCATFSVFTQQYHKSSYYWYWQGDVDVGGFVLCVWGGGGVGVVRVVGREGGRRLSIKAGEGSVEWR